MATQPTTTTDALYKALSRPQPEPLGAVVSSEDDPATSQRSRKAVSGTVEPQAPKVESRISNLSSASRPCSGLKRVDS